MTNSSFRGNAHYPTYCSWVAMKQRVQNPWHDKYHNYGGRGIGIEESWNVYHNFLMDMGERPAGTTLDRLDNNFSYTKENCRWATREEQNGNRRTGKNNSSGYPGVYKYKGTRWRVSIQVNKEVINLGCYRSFEEAVARRKEAEIFYRAGEAALCPTS